jgi:hypothetical protein
VEAAIDMYLIMAYKYYVFGHYPSSCLFSKSRPVSFSKHNVSETGFCPRPQVKPTQLGTIDRASPYLRTLIDNAKLIKNIKYKTKVILLVWNSSLIYFN